MFDYHIHSDISFDATGSLPAIVASAAAKGLKEICITEHMDIDPAGLTQEIGLDFGRYDREFAELMQTPRPIAVRQGVELGALGDRAEEFTAIALAHDYDFIICSQHFVGTRDPYYPSFYEGLTMHEAYLGYLEAIYETLKVFHEYDVVGHIGYPSKYYRGDGPCKFQYSEFPDIIDAILKQAVSDGKGIEANTSSIPKTADTIATLDMLRRFRQLGGEMVTVGSDSHAPENVGNFVPRGLEIIKEAGFKYVCTFEKRKPTFHKIP
ncbi:MAG: histidinol-phosphatase HisJ family protein [Christensenellaceae bacterium]|nr:histidinol-phosphatase HisJ family protein [Christensenellaceae bacterium]